MNELFSKMTSLGFAVMISPEVLLLGLWLAASQGFGRRKAWAFFAGGIVGLMTLVTAGTLIGPANFTAPSWPGFVIRVIISVIIFYLGIHVLFKKRGQDGHLSRKYNAEKVSPLLSFCLGLVITIPNIKITMIALSAGGKISAVGPASSTGIGALLIFIGMGSVPLMIPAVIETIRLGISGKIIHPCTILLEKYGKWVVAAICFILGLQFFQNALKIMPG